MAWPCLAAFCFLVFSLQVEAQITCYPDATCGASGAQTMEFTTALECCQQDDPSVLRSYAPTDGSAVCQECFVIRFEEDNIEVNENTGVVSVTVNPTIEIATRRSNIRRGAFSVSAEVVPGSSKTATIGEDFILPVGMDTISGELTSVLPGTISFQLVDDQVPGEVESFELRLANAELTPVFEPPLQVLVANTLTVDINDDDVIRVGFRVTEYTVVEDEENTTLTFDFGNPIIVDTHFFVLCMTFEEYDLAYPELNMTYPGLAQFSLSDEYDPAEPGDFVSRRIPFTIPGNTTVENQSVVIMVDPDDMLEPVREGFRLLIVVDTTRTPLSQVNFDEQIQLAIFRIDDRSDNITFGFIMEEKFIDEPKNTEDIPLPLAIRFDGTTEYDITMRFEMDMDATTAQVGRDFDEFSGGQIAIVNFNQFSPSEGVFSVAVHPDALFEGDERIVVNLASFTLEPLDPFVPINTNPPLPDLEGSKPDGDQIIFELEQTAIIIRGDDNLNVTLTVPVTVREGEMFYPQLTVSQQVLADFFVDPISGTVDFRDFSYNSEAIQFAESNFTLATPFPVQTEPDKLVEPNETITFSATISGSPGLAPLITYINSPATVLIIDNNTATIGFTEVSISVNENAGPTSVTVALLGDMLASNAEVQVRLFTEAGTAAAGDFGAVDRVLTFTSAVNEFTVPITITDDDVFEDTEMFTANLELVFSEVNTVIAPSQATISINDDDPVELGFDMETYSTSETLGLVTLTVTVTTGVPPTGFTLQLQATGGSATVGDDYSAVTQQFQLDSTKLSYSFNVTIVDDDVVELAENIIVSLTRVTTMGRITITRGTATVNIDDDDKLVLGFSQAAYTGTEGGSVVPRVTVISGHLAPSLTVDVSFSNADGTATATSDYTSVSDTLTFSSSVEQHDVSVALATDDIFEGTENFLANLVLGTTTLPVSLDIDEAQLNINDASTITIGFSVASQSINEDTGTVTLEVSVTSGTLDRDLDIGFSTVALSSNNAATSDVDYTFHSGTLSFSSSISTATITVSISIDSVVENDETFQVSLDSSEPRVSLSPSSAVVTILNDDSATVGFEQPSYTFVENIGTGIITVKLSGTLDASISVPVLVSTTAGTATAGSDYVSIMSKTLVFNSTVISHQLALGIISDDRVEGDESLSAGLSLGNPSQSAVITFSQMSTTITITDNSSVVIGFSPATYSVVESVGTVDLLIEVFTGEFEKSVLVNFETFGHGIVGEISGSTMDLVPISSQTLTFTDTMPKVVTLNITDDLKLEMDENFFARLTLVNADPGVTLDPAEAQITIENDEVVDIGFEQSVYSVAEGDMFVDITFSIINDVTISGSSDPVEVTFEATAGSATDPADYSCGMPVTYTFTATNTQFTVRCTITEDDVSEDFEMFTIMLTTTSSDVILSPAKADVEIFDDDKVAFSFDRSLYMAMESDRNADLVITKTGSSDYTRSIILIGANQTDSFQEVLEFSPSQAERNFLVPLLDDDIALEDLELLAQALQVPADQSSVAELGTQPTSAIEVADDDVLTLQLHAPSIIVESITPFPVTVMADKDIATPLDLNVSSVVNTTEGLAQEVEDYIGFSRTVTMTPGLPLDEMFTEMIVNDGVLERLNERFDIQMELADPASTGLIDIAVEEVSVIIRDDDVVEVGFNAVTYEVLEGDGSFSFEVEVKNGGMFAVPIQFAVTDTEAGALRTADYDGLGSLVLTIQPGQTSIQQTVTIVNDDVTEVDRETFTLTLVDVMDRVSAQSGFDTATVTIVDDDSVTIGFDSTVYTVSEDVPVVEVCAGISGGSLAADRSVTVEIKTMNGTAFAPQDYTAIDLTFTLTSTMTSMCFNITVVPDDLLEMGETFDVGLTSTDPSATLDPNNAQITIVDDDSVSVSFKSSRYVFQESAGMAVVEVVLTGEAAVDVTVSVKGGPSTQTTVGPDRVTFDSTLTFVVGGPTELPASAGIVDDNVAFEDDETVDVSLSIVSPLSDVSLGIFPATEVIIVDNDPLTVTISPPQIEVNETVGTINLCVSKDLHTIEDVTFNLQYIDVSAFAGSDYIILVNSVTIPANDFEACFSVQIVNDREVEPDMETFYINVTYTGAGDVTLGPPSVFDITINEDDVPGVLVCTLSDSLVLETFSNAVIMGPSFSISEGCEHRLVTTCDEDALDLEIRVDFFENQFDTIRVSIYYEGETVIINEDLTLNPPDAPDNSGIVYSSSPSGSVSVSIPDIMLVVTRNATALTIANDNNTLPVAGLCGCTDGLLYFPNCKDTVPLGSSVVPFKLKYKVKPSDRILREARKECGTTANDTVIGDPLMTVPINAAGYPSDLHLCYEIHGAADQYFNLVSDECTSVNAHYAEVPGVDFLNIIDSMAFVAVDSNGECQHIGVDVVGCAASINGSVLQVPTPASTPAPTPVPTMEPPQKRSVPGIVYYRNGITVRAYTNRVRISVPNCADNSLVMWVFCQNQAIEDPMTGSSIGPVDMIKFEITRGLNLLETSHGLIGQFWNVPVVVQNFTGDFEIPENSSTPSLRNVTVYHPLSDSRSFVGVLYDLTWEFEAKKCLYVGNRQGGPIGEVDEPNDSVIEGSYRDYVTADAYATDFAYSHFEKSKCSNI